MSNLYAVVSLNGNRYRVQGLSHDSQGARIYYERIEDMEKRFSEQLDTCTRLDDVKDLQAAWHCTKGNDHYHIEAHLAVTVPSERGAC